MKQDVFKKIGTILNELTEQYEYLQDTPRFNELELELFAANAQFLKDHAEILRKLHLQEQAKESKNADEKIGEEPKVTTVLLTPPPPIVENKPVAEEKPLVIPASPVEAEAPEAVRQQPITPEPVAPPEHKFFEPVVQQVRNVPAIEAIEEPQIEHEQPEEPAIEEREIRHELVVDDKDWDETAQAEDFVEADELTETEIETETETEVPVSQAPEIVPAPAPAPEPQPQPVVAAPNVVEFAAPAPNKPEPVPAEVPKPLPVTAAKEEEPLTLNQRMFAQMAQKAEPAAAAPIADLKAAITLNDKLLFVNELFNGYSLAYSEAIEILNRFNSFDEAERFLKANYVAKNNWEGKTAAADKFYSFLKRRYA